MFEMRSQGNVLHVYRSFIDPTTRLTVLDYPLLWVCISSASSYPLLQGIRCTTIKNDTRPPPNRSGNRIEAARKTFGTSTSSLELLNPQQPFLDTFPSAFFPYASNSSPFAGPSSNSFGDLFSSTSQVPAPCFIPSFQSTQSILARQTIGQALEQDLVESFFSTAHTATQALDAIEFGELYRSHNCQSSSLPQDAQCAIALMCAFGSRFSQNPVFFDCQSSSTTPGPGSARQAAARVLINRALDMFDSFGILRMPTEYSPACIVMANNLLDGQTLLEEALGLPSRNPGNQVQQRMIGMMLFEHITSLELWEKASERQHQQRRPDGTLGLNPGER